MSVNSQLLTAANYAILAGAGVTNTGTSIIALGNLGSSPTPTYTLDGLSFVLPAKIDTANAAQAIVDGNLAYLFYAGQSVTQTMTTADLGTQAGGGASVGHYFPGVYKSASSLAITTPITVDAQGNPNAVFVFIAVSTVTQAIAGVINLAGGAQANNIIWVVGSSWTTIGPGAVTVGNILANTSITLGGGSLSGRALAGLVTSSGAVTIATATNITVPGVAGGTSPVTVVPLQFPEGSEYTQKSFHFRGTFVITTVNSGSPAEPTAIYPAGGWAVAWTDISIRTLAVPFEVTVWSAAGSGYVYKYNKTSGTLQIFVGGGTGQPQTELVAGLLPPAVVADVIQFDAKFPKFGFFLN